MSKIVDLSQSIIEDGYNNPAFADGRLELCMDYDPDGWHAEVYTAATHVGTHIDAPMHKLEGGKPLSAYPLERFTGRAVVCDFRSKGADGPIGREDLEAYDIQENDFVILYTGWDRYRTPETRDLYLQQPPFLAPDGAAYLVERRAGMAMIDYYNIGGNTGCVDDTHITLLSNDVLICEGLRIPEELLEPRGWQVFAFPMKFENCSGAPVRVVAMAQS